MTNDSFTRALHALRDSAEESPATVEATRQRILASLSQRKQSRSIHPMAMAAAGVMALALGSSAWAAVTGHWPWQPPRKTVPALPVRSQPVAPPVTPSTPVPQVVSHSAPVVVVRNDTTPIAVPTPTTVAIAVNTGSTVNAGNAHRTTPTTTVSTLRNVPRATTTTTTSSVRARANVVGTVSEPVQHDTPSSTDGLYQRGHTAQFVTRDMHEALTAWDAYLHEDPNGRYAPEARFNRAIALVRLGRRSEALTALHAIANTSYRAADVQRLIQALETSSQESTSSP